METKDAFREAMQDSWFVVGPRGNSEATIRAVAAVPELIDALEWLLEYGYDAATNPSNSREDTEECMKHFADAEALLGRIRGE
jgi:hypothetical protein